MYIGGVRTFDTDLDLREQALKILEEAAEVFSQFDNSWTEAETDVDVWHVSICQECADVIMATSNLLAKIGIKNMQPWIQECEQRQMDRGRYDVQE